MYRENIPNIRHGAYRKLYDKAMLGKSLSSMLRCKCLDCICFQPSEVAKCGIPACPLYPYTHKIKKKGSSKQLPESILAQGDTTVGGSGEITDKDGINE